MRLDIPYTDDVDSVLFLELPIKYLNLLWVCKIVESAYCIVED